MSGLGVPRPADSSERCPDSGACHHECVGGCFRVQYCAPLSIAKFPGDEWPASCIEVYGQPREWKL